MNFRIADTFTDSLAKLSGDEQKAVEYSTPHPVGPRAPLHNLRSGMNFRWLTNQKGGPAGREGAKADLDADSSP